MPGWCNACTALPVTGDPHRKCLRHTNCFKKMIFRPSGCPACKWLFRRADAGNERTRRLWRVRLARMKTLRRKFVDFPWSNTARPLFPREDAVRYNPLWARVNTRGVKGSARDDGNTLAYQECEDFEDMEENSYEEEVEEEVALPSDSTQHWTSDAAATKEGESSRQSSLEDDLKPPGSMIKKCSSFEKIDPIFSGHPSCLDDTDEGSYNVPCLCRRDSGSSSSHASWADKTRVPVSEGWPKRVYLCQDDWRRRIPEKSVHAAKESISGSNVCDIVCEKLQSLEKNIQQYMATREGDTPNLSRNVEEFCNENSAPSIKIRVVHCGQSDNNEINSSAEATSTTSILGQGSEQWFTFPKEANVISISPLAVKCSNALFGPEDIDIKGFGNDTFFKPLNNSNKVLNLKRVSINENSISKLMTLHDSKMKGVCGWSLGRNPHEILIEDISSSVSSAVRLAEKSSDVDLSLNHRSVSSIVTLNSSENSSEFVDMLRAPQLKANPFRPHSTTNGGIFSAISVDLRAKEYQQRKLSETSFKTIEGLECASKMLRNYQVFSEDSSPAAFETFFKEVGDFLAALAHQQTPLLAHHLSKVFTIRKIMRSELTSEAKPVQMVSKLMSAPLVAKELFPESLIEKVLKSHASLSADSKTDDRDRPEVLFDFPMETLND